MLKAAVILSIGAYEQQSGVGSKVAELQQLLPISKRVLPLIQC